MLKKERMRELGKSIISIIILVAFMFTVIWVNSSIEIEAIYDDGTIQHTCSECC